MAMRRRQTDFDGEAFYLVAFLAACAFGWRDLLAMFIGEHGGIKLFFAVLILPPVMQLFNSTVALLHQFFVNRLGEFRGVVMTSLIILLVVRGSLAISARPHAQYEHESQSASAEESPGF